MNIDIRQVGPDDASLFERVAPDVFDAAIDPGRLAVYLAAPGHFMLVAVYAGEIVGQIAAVVHRHPDQPAELYIDNLGVTPALHRRGIARRLVAAVLALGRELGCGESWVGTENDNIAARGLYRAFNPAIEDAFVMYLYDL